MDLIGGILGPGTKWVRKLRECEGSHFNIKEAMWPRLGYLGTSFALDRLNQQLFAHQVPLKGFYLFTLESLGTTAMWNSGRLILSPGRCTHPQSAFFSEPLNRPYRGGVSARLLDFHCPKCCVSKRNNTRSRSWELVQPLPALKQLRLSTSQQANDKPQKIYADSLTTYSGMP